jgi:hypothetical protein
MARFQAGHPDGVAVQQLEILVRTALFQPANALVGVLLQEAADRIDSAYQPKPGQQRKGRETLQVQGIFGSFKLERDYYHHEGKTQGHYPADAGLGLEVSYTPALAKLICLEGADEPTYLKAERHLAQTGGITVSARQIQRVVQRVGSAAQNWQERPAHPGFCDAPIMYVSADGTGVPMVAEELAGRRGKHADGTAKTRQAYLGCVFTQHRTDEKGHPVRDWESTTYVSSFQSIDEFGPCLRQEAIRRGMGSAGKLVLLIDGAVGLENMGKHNFKESVQIVDFYHAMEHAVKVLDALIGKTHPDFKKPTAQRQSSGVDRPNTSGMCRPVPGASSRRRTGLLRAKRQAHAIRQLSSGRLLHRFRGGRSRLQNRNRRTLQTVRHVLVEIWSRKYPGATLHP